VVRSWILMGMVVTFVSLFPRPASAHGDVRLVDETFPLPAGGTVEFDGGLHYHRVVGRLDADQPITVELIDTARIVTVMSFGPAHSISINRLVQCCEVAWASHRLVIRNHGTESATVDARVTFVHDDLAVMVYRAESGTAESVAVMGGIWWWVVRRVRRGQRSTSAARAATTAATVLAFVLAVAAWGAFRYGGGGAPALVAGAADVPMLPINPLASRASLLMGVMMIGWAVAGVSWIRARHGMPTSSWIALGAVLVGGIVATAAFVTSEYEALGMPLAMAVVFTIPLVVVLVRDGRAHQRDGEIAERVVTR
jgi:hypothetical protein